MNNDDKSNDRYYFSEPYQDGDQTCGCGGKTKSIKMNNDGRSYSDGKTDPEHLKPYQDRDQTCSAVGKQKAVKKNNDEKQNDKIHSERESIHIWDARSYKRESMV